MNYINQYIRENQASYPATSKTPVSILTHLLYISGNGATVIDNNFVALVSFNRAVPFAEYHKDQRTFDELVKIIEMNEDTIIESLFINASNKQNEYCNRLTSDELYKKVVNEYCNRYSEITSIDDLADDCLTNRTEILNQITKGDWLPFLMLSPNYYKQYLLNENTDKDMRDVAIALSEAYIQFMTMYIKNPDNFSHLKSPVSNYNTDEIINVYKSDIKLLSNDIIRLR